jgi:hypothetical protein
LPSGVFGGARELAVDPDAQSVEQRASLLDAPRAARARAITGHHRLSLDAEDGRDELERLERDAIAGASSLDKAATPMAPAPRPRASALDERRDTRAVALHGPGEIRP